MKHLFTKLLAFLLLASQLAAQAQATNTKIPLKPSNWYQLNNPGDGVAAGQGFVQFSNSVAGEYVVLGWGKVRSQFDCYYEFKDLQSVSVARIKLAGGWNESELSRMPVGVYLKKDATSAPQLVTTFNGASGGWIDYVLPQPIDAKYLILRVSGNAVPAEIELYGSYQTASPPALFAKKLPVMRDGLGDNSFIWEFVGAQSDQVDADKMRRMSVFTQYRDYVDWGRLEYTEGQYTFDYTASGSWNYDDYYTKCKAAGKDVLLCLKTLPGWFLDKHYPSNVRNEENVPAPYGSDKSLPASYLAQAKMGFQIAARYGRNTQVPTSLLSGVSTGLVYSNWWNGPTRTLKVGLNLITYVECENERDKWWKGDQAYQNAREYAANLSAFYDGDMGKLGPGVGVKSADPTMQVVMGGLAAPTTDYLRGMIDWCKEYRGYKPDGTVNLCFDVVNYHAYPNANGVSQSGTSARGAAPELSAIGDYADQFVALAREYNLEVWVTETGYDVNQGSPLHAPPIGSKSPSLVAADWTVRTSLLYARRGVCRVFHYQTYDNGGGAGMFSSAGMLNLDGTPRPASAYLSQVFKLMGGYKYVETISTTPLVDRYELSGRSAYVLTMATETGDSLNFSLPISSGRLYSLSPYADSASSKRLLGPSVMVTETPKIVIGPTASALPVTLLSFIGRLDTKTNFISLDWHVIQQGNIDKYLVEASQDGVNFQPIGTVMANNSGGANHSYTYSFPALPITTYCRLKVLEALAPPTYSPVLAFGAGGSQLLVRGTSHSYGVGVPDGEIPDRLLTYDLTGRLLTSQTDLTVLPVSTASPRLMVITCKSGKRLSQVVE